MGDNKTREWLRNKREAIQAADYDEATQQAIIGFLDAYDPDNFRLKPPVTDGNGREDTLAASSRLGYARTLHRTAQYHDLHDCTAGELNAHASARMRGDHETAKDEGLSQNTIHQNQVAWRAFYRFHQAHPDGADVVVDPEDIVLVERDSGTVDERDMFDADEIDALRTHCRNKRDRAVLELLIYTGQRHNALRMLTVGDVRPDEGESGKLYLPDIEGMKGAEGKRPLLGAQKACREWKAAHPTGESEDAFITHVYDWSGHDDIEAGDHLSRQAFGNITKRIGERAGVDKPLNPHQFRHYFTTMAVSKHGMSMDTVRHLLGHAADSRELERTYQHLVDEDHIENAELDMGIREEREESLTPSTCEVCNEPLEPSWSVCPNCEAVYGPDAKSVQDEIEDRKTETAFEVDPEHREVVERFMAMLDDPAILNELVQSAEDADEPTDVFDGAV
jgi:integrase/recombinase XerD